MIKLPEPLGYLCDWGDDRYGLPNQIVYYGGPGSAIEDGWSEHPEVHLNTPIHTEAQLKQAVRDAYEDAYEDAAKVSQQLEVAIDGGGNTYYRPADARQCVAAIRALIKEIPE